MKQFMEGLLEWKNPAAYVFSGSIVLCVIVMFFLGESTVPIPVIVSLFIISAIGTFIQYLAFTDRIIKKMRYTYRMIIFAVPFFVLLAVNAYIFSWFPLETSYWLIFTIIFLVVFAIMSAAFEVYFRIMGKKYDGLLGQYRKQRESQAKQRGK